jgi:cell division septation protein DedD
MQAAHESDGGKPVYRSWPLTEWLCRLLVGFDSFGTTFHEHCKYLVNFVQFTPLYTKKKLEYSYLLKSMARATAVIPPPYFAGYDLIIPAAGEGDCVFYIGVQFKNWSSNSASAAAEAFNSMLSSDQEMEKNGMKNVLGILVHLCGKEDEDIGRMTRKQAVERASRDVTSGGVVSSVVKMSPCARVRVYTVKEVDLTHKNSPFRKRPKPKPESKPKPKPESESESEPESEPEPEPESEPEPAPKTFPLFVLVIGLKGFKSLVRKPDTRELFMNMLNLRLSPSQTGSYVKVNPTVYPPSTTLYGDQLSEAICSAAPHTYDEDMKRRLRIFHQDQQNDPVKEALFVERQEQLERKRQQERLEAARSMTAAVPSGGEDGSGEYNMMID